MHKQPKIYIGKGNGSPCVRVRITVCIRRKYQMLVL